MNDKIRHMPHKNRTYCSDYIPAPDPARIRQTIAEGQNFMDRNIPEQTSLVNLIKDQLRYISKFFWACQLAVLAAAIYLGAVMLPELTDAGILIFRLAPFIGFLAVPEMVKDIYWDMSELENVCKNNSSTILLIRLAIVGAANIFTLTVAAGIFVQAFSESYSEAFVKAVVCGLTPFLWENVINMFLLKMLRVRGRLGAVAISAVPVMAGLAAPQALLEKTGMELLWLAALLAGGLVLAGEVKLLLREKREGVFLWNLE